MSALKKLWLESSRSRGDRLAGASAMTRAGRSFSEPSASLRIVPPISSPFEPAATAAKLIVRAPPPSSSVQSSRALPSTIRDSRRTTVLVSHALGTAVKRRRAR